VFVRQHKTRGVLSAARKYAFLDYHLWFIRAVRLHINKYTHLRITTLEKVLLCLVIEDSKDGTKQKADCNAQPHAPPDCAHSR